MDQDEIFESVFFDAAVSRVLGEVRQNLPRRLNRSGSRDIAPLVLELLSSAKRHGKSLICAQRTNPRWWQCDFDPWRVATSTRSGSFASGGANYLLRSVLEAGFRRPPGELHERSARRT